MILAADNIRITSREIEKSIQNMNPTYIKNMAEKLVTTGAEAIDINPGPLTSDPEEKMKFLGAKIDLLYYERALKKK